MDLIHKSFPGQGRAEEQMTDPGHDHQGSVIILDGDGRIKQRWVSPRLTILLFLLLNLLIRLGQRVPTHHQALGLGAIQMSNTHKLGPHFIDKPTHLLGRKVPDPVILALVALAHHSRLLPSVLVLETEILLSAQEFHEVLSQLERPLAGNLRFNGDDVAIAVVDLPIRTMEQCLPLATNDAREELTFTHPAYAFLLMRELEANSIDRMEMA